MTSNVIELRDHSIATQADTLDQLVAMADKLLLMAQTPEVAAQLQVRADKVRELAKVTREHADRLAGSRG